MSDFLDAMFAASQARAELTRERFGVSGLEALASDAPPPVPLHLEPEGFDLVAEVKPASPSEGRLMDRPDVAGVVDLALDLVGAGPAALSVLTEPSVFGGDLTHLESAVRSVHIPVMRKDFIVDPIQILEARVSGASGVLIIARRFGAMDLKAMTDLALELGMFVLVEVFDDDDLAPASAVFDRPVLIGVNSRDLVTLEVDTKRHAAMKRRLPGHLPAVAESGLIEEGDVAAVAAIGYRLALVGSALARSLDPAQRAMAMIQAGREASRSVVGT
jgi:indole-3-glycerol phosphate synthase